MNPRHLFLIVMALMVTGCTQDMGTWGHLTPYQYTKFFKDRSTALQPPAGTIAIGHLSLNPAVDRGEVNGKLVKEIPIPITRKLVERGQQRYNIYCAPCHGLSGYGDGMIVRRGFLAPPSYHSDRLRKAPAGHFFDVITHGYGAMYSYADRVNVHDRWAIIAYIRVLQTSQHTSVASLTPQERKKLRTGPTVEGHANE